MKRGESRYGRSWGLFRRSKILHRSVYSALWLGGLRCQCRRQTNGPLTARCPCVMVLGKKKKNILSAPSGKCPVCPITSLALPIIIGRLIIIIVLYINRRLSLTSSWLSTKTFAIVISLTIVDTRYYRLSAQPYLEQNSSQINLFFFLFLLNRVFTVPVYQESSLWISAQQTPTKSSLVPLQHDYTNTIWSQVIRFT